METADIESAGYAARLDIVLEQFGPAVRVGLRPELLVCMRRLASERHLVWASLERDFALTAKAKLGQLNSVIAGAIDTSRLDSLQETLRRQKHRRGTPFRRPNRTPEERRAAESLIAFVQDRFKELRDSFEPGEPMVLGAIEGWPLVAIQDLAFKALATSHGCGDAKRIQLRVTDNAPLAVCRRCWSIFADNSKVAGRNMVTRTCPGCRKKKASG